MGITGRSELLRAVQPGLAIVVTIGWVIVTTAPALFAHDDTLAKDGTGKGHSALRECLNPVIVERGTNARLFQLSQRRTLPPVALGPAPRDTSATGLM